ncbi:exoribonuclease R [Rheinheimera sp. KL1]|uniref:ribonuclease R n=1 Tax=Rheinheimera sp. KL1 TaxID=1635005 RepID=UPI0006A9F8A8|nr:ribonuclease R [Rheinheimera sp. KL1]KOO58927.1 exoribonuclease R [Rheinheimera sp. KL1]
MTVKDPHLAREQEKYENPIPSREFILEHLKQRQQPAYFEELAAELKLTDDEAMFALKKRLRAMERDGQLLFNKSKRYGLVDDLDLVKGTVLGHRDGFGFLKLEQGGPDWFIPNFEMKRLLHGDVVLASKSDFASRDKVEARIVRILEPRNEPIVGRYFKDFALGVVVPDDPRLSQDIVIPPGEEGAARHGQVVLVEISQRPSKRVNAVGKVIEVLGEHMAPGMEIEIAIRNHQIPHEFSKAVEQQVAGYGTEVPEEAKAGRVDLTQLGLITIDGEDARDFDDAVYCERKADGGWHLWVAIADVSAYVLPDTPLDKEALDRGNSVYFPDHVVPMLPEVLSNGLCSLNPHTDRLCFVAEMHISKQGKLDGYQFYEAVMHSSARLTYNKVHAILEGDPKLRQQYEANLTNIDNLYSLYKQMAKVRAERGAIEFETVETRFIFNSHRKIEQIVPIHRNEAHKIIEECMILANVSAAKLIEKHEAFALFRVHERPDGDRFANFRRFLAELGIEANLPVEPTPLDLMLTLQKLQDRPDKELIETTMLRSMKQAVYQGDNLGHFGLALEAYAHFTSPIRRYPDLVLHRAIKAILQTQGQKVTGPKGYTEKQIHPLGEQCSMTERRADDATREVADWLKCEYMQDHIGDSFKGVVSTVTNFGLFVRITDLYIEGLVHVTSLQNDYYHFDTERQVLRGEHSNVQYRMGDLIEVKVLAVNLEARKIDLGIVGMEKRTTSNRKISASKKAAMTPAEEKASMRKKGARKAGIEQTAPAKAGKKPAGKKPTAKKPAGSKPAAKSPAAKSPAGPRPGKAPRKRK